MKKQNKTFLSIFLFFAIIFVIFSFSLFYISYAAKNYKLNSDYKLNYELKEKRFLQAPSIDDLKGVVYLNDNSYLFYGDTKSFTQNGSDFLFVKVNETNNDYEANVGVLSGLFNDNLINTKKYKDYLIAVGNTWSYNQDTLEDILVSILDNNLNLIKYYVISGNRQEDASNISIVDNVPFILSSTRSATFGKENSLIIKLDDNLDVDKIYLIGTNSEDKPYYLYKLGLNKYLLVGSYLRASGNKDIYFSILDGNFNFIRGFGLGGAFDENIKASILYKDKLIFISQTRSFKPYEKENVLINLVDLKSMKILRSLALGTINDDYYLSYILNDDNLTLFIDSRNKDTSEIFLVYLNPNNLNLNKIVTLKELLSDTSYNYFTRLRSLFVLNINSRYIDFAVNVVNTDTLEDYAVFKVDNFLDSLYKDKNLKEYNISKYYLKVSKYPNLEYYDLSMNTKLVYSKDLSDNTFKVDNNINIKYLQVDVSSIWK
ncbi:MAG: hypothetical protein ACP5RD_02475 [bacterium]